MEGYGTLPTGVDPPIPIEKTRERRALAVALVFCTIFMVVELYAGYISHSLAIFTDAAHLMTDVGAYIISIVAVQTSLRQSSTKYSYGFARAEVVGTLFSVFTMWALVGGVAVEAVHRIVNMLQCVSAGDVPDRHLGLPPMCANVLDTRVMVLIGFWGLLVNIGCAAILHYGGASGHGHSHGGDDAGHSRSFSGESSPLFESLGENMDASASQQKVTGFAVHAAMLHAMSDCLQSLGVVLMGAFAWGMNVYSYGTPTYARSPYNLADPIASLIFGVVTLRMTRGIIKNLLNILMEAAPHNIDADAVLNDLKSLEGVVAVHNLHIWSITTGKVALSVHLVSDDHQHVLHKAQRCIHDTFKIGHHTIQIEPTSTLKCVSSTYSH